MSLCRESDVNHSRFRRVSQVSITKDIVTTKGPKGTLTHASVTRTSRSSRPRTTTARTSSCSSAKSELGPQRAAHGLMRALVGNMLTGVTTGFTAHARDQRRRLQGRAQGPEDRPLARVLAPDRVRAARRHRGQGRQEQADPVGHRSPGARRGGRRRSAASVRPSRTRARASSTSKRRSRRKAGKTAGK